MAFLLNFYLILSGAENMILLNYQVNLSKFLNYLTIHIQFILFPDFVRHF